MIKRSLLFAVFVLTLVSSAPSVSAQVAPWLQPTPHADPLDFDPTVREGYTRFYNLDYDGALERFDQVIKQHPQDPIAYAYALQAIIFRELYRQDLLDTTYYAHDSFLTTQRKIDISPANRERIEFYFNHTQDLADARLKVNDKDKDALFARGFARGLHAAYLTLADHAWFASARQGLSARNDSEAVLKIDPQYADADLAVGIQQFAVASLPRFVRLIVGISGVGGNKEKGLDLLKVAAQHGIITSVEARTSLSLFLRHDGRYAEALVVQHGLAVQFPHDYLFRLEEANIAKDEGHGPQAIEIYRQVLADAKKPGFFVDPRLQLAYFGIADTERGQNQIKEAARDYLEAASQPNSSDWLRKRAQLYAGEMLDLLHDHAAASVQYDKAAASGGDQSQAELARKLKQNPYTGK